MTEKKEEGLEFLRSIWKPGQETHKADVSLKSDEKDGNSSPSYNNESIHTDAVKNTAHKDHRLLSRDPFSKVTFSYNYDNEYFKDQKNLSFPKDLDSEDDQESDCEDIIVNNFSSKRNRFVVRNTFSLMVISSNGKPTAQKTINSSPPESKSWTEDEESGQNSPHVTSPLSISLCMTSKSKPTGDPEATNNSNDKQIHSDIPPKKPPRWPEDDGFTMSNLESLNHQWVNDIDEQFRDTEDQSDYYSDGYDDRTIVPHVGPSHGADGTDDESHHHHDHHHHDHQHRYHYMHCRHHHHCPNCHNRIEISPAYDYNDYQYEPPEPYIDRLKSRGSKTEYSCLNGIKNGCGRCKNCKTSTMYDLIENLTASIDCEIHDVAPDGNCMFRSIVDQLRMNGEFHWTAANIRQSAVQFLSDNPKDKDGSHLAMFLSNETWSEYLCRMSRDKEWGDQLVLRGVSEVIARDISIISAIGSEHNQTTISPALSAGTGLEPLQLGHIDEQHYVSLRKRGWQDTWLENGRRFNGKDDIQIEKLDIEDEESIKTYFSMKFDPMNETPLAHLNFMVNKVLPQTVFLIPFSDAFSQLDSRSESSKTSITCVGDSVEDLSCRIYHLSPYSINYNKNTSLQFGMTGICVYDDYIILTDGNRTTDRKYEFILDLENMPAAYTKILAPAEFHKHGSPYLRHEYIGNVTYQKTRSKLIPGIRCQSWPLDCLEYWRKRERFSGWPGEELIEKVTMEDCIVIPSASEKSLCPEIEWRFNFMKPVRLLMKEGTTNHQRHCYKILSLLVRFCSDGFPDIPSYAMKTLFLFSLERIPSNQWESNKGACLLFLLDRLLLALHRKHIPDCFIPSCNVLSEISVENSLKLYRQIQAIRQFPLISIIIVAEKYGLPASAVAEPIIDHIERIKEVGYEEGSEKDVFLQTNIEDIKNKVFYFDLKNAAEALHNLYEDDIYAHKQNATFDQFAYTCLQDLPYRMQWWVYFFVDHFYKRNVLQSVMGGFGGTYIGQMLPSFNEEQGPFDNVVVPHQLMQETRFCHIYENDIGFVIELCTMLTSQGLGDLCVQYYRRLISLIKSKLMEVQLYKSPDVQQYDVNYQAHTLSIKYSEALVFTCDNLYWIYHRRHEEELISEYLDDIERACDTLRKNHHYTILASIYKSLGCAEKYQEILRKCQASEQTSEV